MNLVYIWIEEYRNIYKKGYVMNANYTITKSKDFDFVIEKKEALSIYANDKIIDSYILLGKNGLGKTTLLRFISYKFLDEHEYCKMCMIYEKDNKYYVYKHGFDDKDIITITSYNNKIRSDGYSVLTDVFIKYKLNFVSVYFEGSEYPNYYPVNLNSSIKYYNISTLDFIKNDFNKVKNNLLGFEGNKDIQIDYRIHESTFRIVNNILNSINSDEVKLLKIIFINCFFSYFRIYNNKSHEFIYEILDEFLMFTFNGNEFEKFVSLCINKWQEIIVYLTKNTDEQYNLNLLLDNKFERVIKDILYCIKNLKFLKLKDNKIFFKLSDISDNESNYNNLKEYLNILKKYKLENTFEINVTGSKGENAFIHNLAVIDTILNELKENITEDKIVYLCIDEIEQNLHPEWCRLLYSKISQLINTSDVKGKFYLYMSTHSPYVISDFTSDHIINLDDTDNNGFQTFGSNIHDILSKGMFLDNPMGEYAYSMIRRVHKALCTDLSREEIFKACGMDEKKLRYFIDCIGEPLIKIQLSTLYEKVFEVEKNKIKISRNELKNVKTEEQLIQLLNNCNIEVE